MTAPLFSPSPPTGRPPLAGVRAAASLWARTGVGVVAATGMLAGAACASPPAAAQGCEITGQAPAQDVARARTACEQARARFAELTGQPAPPVRVELSDRVSMLPFLHDGRWALRWPATATLRRVGGQLGYPAPALDAWVDAQWRSILPHEIGHVLMFTTMKQPAEPTEPGQYATVLPDWLDEAAAIWMESAQARAARLAQAGVGRQPAPALAGIFAGTHPSADSPLNGWRRVEQRTTVAGKCTGICEEEDPRTRLVTAVVDTLGRLSVDTTFVDPRAPAAEQAGAVRTRTHFYSHALAALAYVHERGGSPAVRQLIDRLRQDPRRADPFAGLPGLPTGAAPLQADWERWWSRGPAAER